VYSGLRRGPGFMWLRREGVRPASRSEDRMAVKVTNRTRAARKSLVKREVASVELSYRIMCGAATGGEREASAVYNVRRRLVVCE